MDALVMVVFLAVTVGGWWWLAKRMKVKGRGWFLRHLAGSSAGTFAGFLVVALALEAGVIQPPEKEDKQPVAAAPAITPAPSAPEAELIPPAEPAAEGAAVAEASAQTKTLGIQPETFADRVNANLRALGQSARVDASSITPGPVNDVLKAQLGAYAAVVAPIDKGNGEVVGLTIIGAGDGTPASGLEIMLMASAALAAVAPGADSRELIKQIPSMVDGKELTYGEVKLSSQRLDQLGTWFIAEPI